MTVSWHFLRNWKVSRIFLCPTDCFWNKGSRHDIKSWVMYLNHTSTLWTKIPVLCLFKRVGFQFYVLQKLVGYISLDSRAPQWMVILSASGQVGCYLPFLLYNESELFTSGPVRRRTPKSWHCDSCCWKYSSLDLRRKSLNICVCLFCPPSHAKPCSE